LNGLTHRRCGSVIPDLTTSLYVLFGTYIPGAEFIGAEGSQLALQGVLSPFIRVARGLIDKCVQAGARESRGEYGAADGNLPGAPS